ncbi:7-carboxy-7-deazaguanine synthase [Pseudomonas virus PBPA162]|uniref:7-carboxy-7-deazaguanine synthase n=1 Tax=Pseudomonas virus PBPA162 TaxID=2588096 RepID=A0A4Y5TQI1_9CAUD|nr:7-carboxy-7-deazaguanine synthase [Pseudomonas virus PBPA162]QDB70840.1 7-carboxy-7-deazaguanine synthase [Pseudomonas virus PBPA162]
MLLNNQIPVKTLPNDDIGVVEVHSIFATIQGEGPFAGRPAVFVRLSGCNLQCPKCDTEYTGGNPLTPRAIVELVRFENKMADYDIHNPTDHVDVPDKVRPKLLPANAQNRLVVITGGEPMRQPIAPLVEALLDAGMQVQIETNGTLFRDLPYSDPNLTIVCSPKTGAVNHKLKPHVRHLKYVAAFDNMAEDGLPVSALDHPNGGLLARPWPSFKGVIYLQPVDEKNEDLNKENMDAVVKSCQRHGYTLCLQMHKIIEVE